MFAQSRFYHGSLGPAEWLGGVYHFCQIDARALFSWQGRSVVCKLEDLASVSDYGVHAVVCDRFCDVRE